MARWVMCYGIGNKTPERKDFTIPASLDRLGIVGVVVKCEFYLAAQGVTLVKILVKGGTDLRKGGEFNQRRLDLQPNRIIGKDARAIGSVLFTEVMHQTLRQGYSFPGIKDFAWTQVSRSVRGRLPYLVRWTHICPEKIVLGRKEA